MKQNSWRFVLAGVLALTGLAVGWRLLAGASLRTVTAMTVSETAETPRPEFQATPEVLALSSLDSPSPTCYRSAPGSGSCYIQWAYIYVVANPSHYVISTTVTIDGQLRAYQSGFFQTFMYLPADLYGPGFRVTCGFPAGGGTGLGRTYTYTIRARDTGGNVGTNSGSVQCPADVVRAFLPIVRK